jgi:hypothetical protein
MGKVGAEWELHANMVLLNRRKNSAAKLPGSRTGCQELEMACLCIVQTDRMAPVTEVSQKSPLGDI